MKFEPKELNIQDLLEDKKVYVVPLFQRSYSWEKSHAEDFINDLLRLSEQSQDEEYFLGTMVFVHGDGKTKTKILDGQQRFATIMLFLKALYEVIKEPSFITFSGNWESDIKNLLIPRDILSKKENLKLELNREDNIFFKELMVDGKECNTSCKSHKKLRDNKNYFKEELRNNISEKGEAFVENILGALLRKTHIIKIDVDSEQSAQIIFETLNDRGMDLSVADLVKNHLLMNSGDDLDEAMQKWENMIDQVGEGKIVQFLRYYWCSFYDFARKDDLYKKLKKEVNAANVKKFISDLGEEAQVFSNLNTPTTEFWGDKKIVSIIDEINILRVDQINIILLSIYRGYYKENKKKFIELLSFLKNFTFRYSTIVGDNPNKLEILYSDLARKVRHKKIDTYKIVNEIKELNPSSQSFVNSFAKLEIKNAKLAKYILFKINESLRDDDNEEMIFNEKEINLEHIIPKKFNEDREWKEYLLKNNISGQNLLNRIGNMTLLLGEYNRKASNKYFIKKQEMYKKSKMPLNKDLKILKEFGKKEVNERQNLLATLAENIWCV